ncbi:hypothetical protein G6F57_013985 [Rhizopus arrhizus]|nr:hypothetical protein G6F57_013985 [Rhizopus arrhizus]
MGQVVEAVVDHADRVAQVFLPRGTTGQVGEIGGDARAISGLVVLVEGDARDAEGKVVGRHGGRSGLRGHIRMPLCGIRHSKGCCNLGGGRRDAMGQGKQGQRPLYRQPCPLHQRRVVHAAIGEIAVGGIDAQRQGAGLEEAEERPQRVVDHQRVAFAAASGGQQDGGIDQRVLVDEVEKVLEQPRVGAAVDRRGHHQHVGLLDRGQLPLHRLGQLRAPQRTGKLRRQLAQLDQVRFAGNVFADQVQQVLGQGCRPRGALQSAGNGGDTEGAGHRIAFSWGGAASGGLRGRSPAGRRGGRAYRQPKA